LPDMLLQSSIFTTMFLTSYRICVLLCI